MHETFNTILAMWTPGVFELIIIAVIALLIFGRRLPEIARGLGRSLAELKKGVREAKDATDEIENDVKDIKNDIVKEVDDASAQNEHGKEQ